MRISAEQRQQNETRIRTAMDRLLRGQIPPGGKCDIKTLAREANVDRTAFYGTRPYAHLRAEFERRLQALHTAGDLPDPREAQIARLKNEVETFKQRIIRRDRTIAELTDLSAEALSRLAAQHDEINRLRRQADGAAAVRQLPTRATTVGPCS
ncbi:hypothetical protein [Nocardioides sp.]|uniref:hypothetical protein n=1 Tax=Nocardioides sp. TaxID=35761 RepID=UPI003D0CE8A9